MEDRSVGRAITAVALLFAFATQAQPSAASIAKTYTEAPFTCTVPILDPSAIVTTSGTKHRLGKKYLEGQQNAQSDIDISGPLQSNFDLAATFTLPLNPANRGFYSNWIILKPFKGDAFVQLELMRWKKYQDRQEIGLTWSMPDGRLIYRDTGVFVTDAPHRLAVGVSAGSVVFNVDGKDVCHAATSVFFQPQQRLYYQIGTEVAHFGDHPTGTVSNIKIRTDEDLALYPVDVTCIYRGYGLSWEDVGDGSFRAEGVFDPTEPYLKFTGLHWDQPCRI